MFEPYPQKFLYIDKKGSNGEDGVKQTISW